jgi:hypothetical protein
MKKTSLLLVIIFATLHCYAQWGVLPLLPVQNLKYYVNNDAPERLLVIDSSIFAIRSGGLQEMSTIDQKSSYYWQNYNLMNDIVADTGNTYVYVSKYKYIGRYNEISHRYENIWTGPANSKQFTGTAVATDGKVWACTENMTKEVGIYDGTNWTFYPFGSYLSYGFSGIKMINDTLACLMSDASVFYTFHNGIFDTLFYYTNYYFSDWDIDKSGNLWIAVTDSLIHVHDGLINTYKSSNTPFGSNKFLHVNIGCNGHVWVSGSSNEIMEFDGSTWQLRSLPSWQHIEDFTLDKQNNPWVVTENSSLYTYNGGVWYHHNFYYMPLVNLKAVGQNTSNNLAYFANDEGIFTMNHYNNSLQSFADTSEFDFANDVTCFAGNNNNYISFGTHSGVFIATGFNNDLLPNDTVNSMYNDAGTYYIGTNAGLISYNGLFYYTFDTSNTPFPSNKITFVSSSRNDNYNNYNALLVGTDKGFAIYKDGQWTKYDTTDIPVSRFYVTGASYAFASDTIYVTTLGDGLLKIAPDGNYKLLNTSNGGLLDDTLYYVKNVELGECGAYTIIGTSHHGIAFTNVYMPEGFSYATQDYLGLPINSSKLISIASLWSETLLVSDSLIYYLSMCGSVAENNIFQNLNWFQHNENLVITIPPELSGDGTFILSNMLGQILVEKKCYTSDGKITVSVTDLSSGIYAFRLTAHGKTGYCKVCIVN